MKEQIKSRILVEMQSVLNREQLQELKLCLDRNLYNVEENHILTNIVLCIYLERLWQQSCIRKEWMYLRLQRF